MTHRQQRWALGATVVAVLVAQPGSAAVKTVSWNALGRGQATVPWFDPALGRLTSITAEATYASQLPLGWSYVPVEFESATTGYALLNNLSFGLSGTAKLQQQPGYWLFSVNESGSATWTDAAILSRFYATSGSLQGYAGASAVAPGVAVAGNFVPTVNYKISYTYDDSPAVPEPATWAMMAGGFGLLGIALRLARGREGRDEGQVRA